MIQPLDRQFSDLEQKRAVVEEITGRMSPAQVAYRLTENSWTTAEVIDHLVRVEASVLNGASKPGVKRDSWKPDLRKRPLLWGVFFLGIRIPVPGRSAHVHPARGVHLSDVLDRWADVRRDWRGFLETLTPEQLRLLAVRHPVAGPFGYSEVLVFLNRHLRHHMRQLERIRRSAGFPKLSTNPEKERPAADRR